MKYMLLMYAKESAITISPEEQKAVMQEWAEFRAEIKASGVMVDSNGFLSVEDATTVRVRDGKTLITDGPFAETHEQLGGYFLLDCKDLDEAIAWAEKIPSAKLGSIEIRPLYLQN